jgi:hypothetical protein
MQRYFFNLSFLRDYVADEEGSELPNLEAAKTEARQVIRELAADFIVNQRVFDLHSVRICDESGTLLAEASVAEALNEVLASHIVVPSNSDSHA